MASHWTPSGIGRPASRGGSQISRDVRPLSAIRPPKSSRAATGVCNCNWGILVNAMQVCMLHFSAVSTN